MSHSDRVATGKDYARTILWPYYIAYRRPWMIHSEVIIRAPACSQSQPGACEPPKCQLCHKRDRSSPPPPRKRKTRPNSNPSTLGFRGVTRGRRCRASSRHTSSSSRRSASSPANQTKPNQIQISTISNQTETVSCVRSILQELTEIKTKPVHAAASTLLLRQLDASSCAIDSTQLFLVITPHVVSASWYKPARYSLLPTPNPYSLHPTPYTIHPQSTGSPP